MVKDNEKRDNMPKPEGSSSNEDLVYGRRPVLELFEIGRGINKLLVAKGASDSTMIKKVISMARERKIPVLEVEKIALDRMVDGANHQGIAGYVSPIEYVEIEHLIKLAEDKNEELFVVLADGVMDPQNLGSIIRTANAAGAHGVVVPARRGAQVSSTVVRASAGACIHTPVARVSNLVQAIDKFKKAGAWVVGTDIEAPKYHYESNLEGKLVVVMGNEGEGISRLVKENCDFCVKMPMLGEIGSLNVGVAWGIIAYEIVRQRLLGNKKSQG